MEMLEHLLRHRNELCSLSFNPISLRMSYKSLLDELDHDAIKLEDAAALMEFVVEILGDWQIYNNYVATAEDRDYFAECVKVYIKF